MPTRAKIRVESIEQLQQALEAAPEHGADEVTKKEAIRRLAPQILAMQSKGYSLTSIASMLTDKGLPVSAVALQSYLQQAKAKPQARRKTRTQVPRDASGGGEATRNQAKAAAPRRANPQTVAPPAPQSTPTKPASPAPAERKSSFVPKPDSDDI